MILALALRTSEYQLLKLRVLDVVPLAKDAVHIYIGFACLLLAVIVLRVPLRSWKALIPGLVATVVMEAFDLRDNRADGIGYQWRASFRDVVNTNLVPVVLVLATRLDAGKDLLGGDFWVDIDQFAERDFGGDSSTVSQNDLDTPNKVVYEDDVFGYDYDIFTTLYNAFGQYEKRWTNFDAYIGGEIGYTTFWRDSQLSGIARA